MAIRPSVGMVLDRARASEPKNSSTDYQISLKKV